MSELISQAITNMQNGVSQQTPALRLSSQCEEQLNCRNDPVVGMGKRFNSVLLGGIGVTSPKSFMIATIERDDTEQYKVFAKSGLVRVLDAKSGTEYPVVMTADAADYLVLDAGTAPRDAFQILNTIDTTFILNRTRAVKRIKTVGVPRTPEALWYIKQADYKVEYKVTLNGVTASIETPEATSVRARAGLDTTKLTSDMAIAINALNASHGCTALVKGNVLIITHDAGADFTISAYDDLGDRAAYAVKGWVSDFSTLPQYAVEGFQVEVRGKAGDTDVEPYHVMYTELDNEGRATAGVWKETLKHGADSALDLSTMPVSLVRGQDAAYITAENPLGVKFSVTTTEFSDRTVGDDVTAPFPSFVSEQDEAGAVLSPRHIQSMLYHKNRLCFVSDENVVFSETGEFLNFFPTTVVTELDSDPIDIALNLNDVAPVQHVVVNAGEMFLFAPEVQLRIKSGEVFNAATLDVSVASRYSIDTRVAPYTHSSVIYFWGRGSRYSTLYEYLPQGDTDRYVALEVTSHVPRYVEGTVVKSVESHSENIMFHMTQAPNGNNVDYIYVTNVLTNGAERVQNAWQKWTFAGNVADVSVKDDALTLIVEYDDGVFLEEIILSHDALTEELGFPVYLDRREEVASSVLPYGDPRVVFQHQGRCWAGFRYTQKYVFSQFFMRDGEGRAVVGGRLQLRYLTLTFHDTTSFTVQVDRQGIDSKSVEYTGRVIGGVLATLNQVPVVHGSKRFPIHTKSDNAVVTLLNDTEQDAVFQTSGWEGTYTRRSRLV